MEPLGLLYSAADSVKRRVKNLLSDPVGYLQQAVDNALPTQYESEQGLLKMRGQDHNPYAAENGDRKVKDLAMNFNPASAGITVWHGTPHKFAPTPKNPLGEFDLGKIGTGEGAQAYGHGVYVAESPEVAGAYSQMRNQTGQIGIGPGVKMLAAKIKEVGAKSGDDVLSALSNPKNIAEKGNLHIAKNLAADGKLDDLVRLANSENSYLYKVDLPDEHLSRFLDWDKPLSQQTPEVRNLLMNDYGLDMVVKDGKVSASPGGLLNGDPSGEKIYNAVSQIAGGEKAAAEYLKNLGIYGHRYLDAGSRDAASGTRNAVIFDPSILNILDRQ